MLPDGQVRKVDEEYSYTYLGILQYDEVIKGMKEKFTQEYKRRLKLALKSKLNRKNKIKVVSTLAVSVLRYGAGKNPWTDNEILDRKTRRFVTMNGVLYPKSDVDRLYLPQRNGGRGLICCEEKRGWYLKNAEEKLLKSAKVTSVLDSEEGVSKTEHKRKWRNEREPLCRGIRK